MALLRCSLLAFVTSLAVPAVANAQNPWTVKVYSTMNPLPIGVCAAVRLDIMDPATRSTPRRPTGDYVTITDFDMTVTSPAGNSVAPHWVTAYHLLACGCQSGSVGDFGVVTATYPAQALPERARMPGVSFQVKGDFSLSRAQNGTNPQSCSTPSVAPVVAVPALPVSPTSVTRTATTPISLAPLPGPVPVRAPAPPPAPPAAPVNAIPTKVSTIPAASVPSSPPVVTGEPLPQIPPEILAAWARMGIPNSADSIYGATIEELKRALTAWMAATGQTGLIPLAGETTVGKTVTPAPVPASSPTLPPSSGTSLSPLPGSALPSQPGVAKTATGTTPTGLRLLPGVPIIANLAWDSMPNAVTYSLRRAVGTGASVERVTLGQAAEKGARDTIPDPRDTYLYTLVVTYADGTWGTSPAVAFVSPPLKNPLGFTARDRGLGNVDFQWQAVDGATRYRLDGPGIVGTGFFTTGTSTSYPKIPGGANSWKLTTLYQGNYADYANPSTASAVVRVLPPHPQPWLSKGNGPGSAATAQAPRRIWSGASFCPLINEKRWGHLDSTFDARTLSWLGAGDQCTTNESLRIGLQQWVNLDIGLWPEPSQSRFEAVYGNAVDLGVGRRARCAQGQGVWPPLGLTTTCYATAHGIVPGEPGFNDFNTITRPTQGVGDDFILAMVISKDSSGSTFLVFLRNSKGLPALGRLTDQVSLDTEGPKYLPHACLSCHGGKYNPKTRKVDGSSFLPLDPGLLAFASPADQAAQEESIREINEIIVASAPTSAVAAYIRGLYGNAVSVPGTLAKVDYVPQGWTAQSGFYRSVVKPYCATCHLAAPESWNFASWDNFKENVALIKAAVCNAHTMPHSELQYKAFWTKDTGPVYLPGLLATTPGWPVTTAGAPPSCP